MRLRLKLIKLTSRPQTKLRRLLQDHDPKTQQASIDVRTGTVRLALLICHLLPLAFKHRQRQQINSEACAGDATNNRGGLADHSDRGKQLMKTKIHFN